MFYYFWSSVLILLRMGLDRICKIDLLVFLQARAIVSVSVELPMSNASLSKTYRILKEMLVRAMRTNSAVS